MMYKWDIKPGFIIKRQDIIIYPTKLDLYNMILKLNHAKNKEKKGDHPKKTYRLDLLSKMIEEFKTLRNSL